jgi:hypothetical protein
MYIVYNMMFYFVALWGSGVEALYYGYILGYYMV